MSEIIFMGHKTKIKKKKSACASRHSNQSLLDNLRIAEDLKLLHVDLM